jgi:ABC-type multidrug transport system ATPase subunit
MSADIVLQTRNLGKRYGQRWAVKDLDLVVRRGEIFGFLGPNGAGKSTTIRMILSLVNPTTGSVELFGKPISGARHELLMRVGGLVERPDFYPYLSGRCNLEARAALRGGIAASEIDEVCALVGLDARAGERVKTYSHGMKQRLGIAQALLGKPDLVILDEPTSGLDPQGIKEVRDLIHSLSRERGMTVFLSSHMLHEIEQTATGMAIINNGQLAVQGSVNELLHDRELTVRIEAYPVDRAMALLEKLPYHRGLRNADRQIELRCSPIHAGEVNRILVQGGVEVRAFVPRRSLEEFFLSITESGVQTGSTIPRGRSGKRQ